MKFSELEQQVLRALQQKEASILVSPEQLQELLLAATQQEGFSPIYTAPKDGTPIDVPCVLSFRFLPFKPKSNEARLGIKGRWQRHTEYGWVNAPGFNGTQWRPVREIK